MRAGRGGEVEVREEHEEDAPNIRRVHEAAFDGGAEALVVELLRRRGRMALGLVAVTGERVVGHVLFSPVSIERAPKGLRAVGLAPLGVLPAFQGRGVGTALVREGLDRCRRRGEDLVVVLGDPRYYGRFGFQPARRFDNEYGAGEAFQVLELRPGALAGAGGLVRYAPEFREAGC